MVLLAYSSSEDVSLYHITTLISVSLLCYSLLFLVFLSTSSVVLKEPVYSRCILSSLLAAILMCTVLKQGLLFSLLVTIPSTVMFAWLLRLCITEYQKTFTLGEAMIVCQSLVLFVVMSIINFFFKLSSGDEEMEFINVIVFMVLSTMGLIVAALYHLNDTQRNLKVLSYIVLSAAGFLLLMLYTIIGADFMTQILGYVFMEKRRVQIFTFWLVLLILAVCSLLVRTKLAVKATTVTRKTFHILASLVFMSGILYDKYYMLLAAGIGLGVLVFIEALRKSGIEPISSALQAAFLVYCDEKDCGVFAMTPLYLYTGLAAPLLLAPAALEQLSGVLAVGVGDTAASWGGARVGRNKWPQSSKTLEGTAFNVLSQIGTVYALTLFGLLSVEASLVRTCLSASVCGLVEALTDQVDNLVLPLVTLLTFRMVLSTVGLIVAALYHLNDTQRNLKVLSYIVLSAAGFLLLMLYTIIGADFMTQILGYVFMEKGRVQIFTFWLVLLILAVCSLLVRTKLAVKATTVTRKTFHILASLVFMSGILYDKYYMLLAAGIGLGVLVFIEALRKSGIEPISSALQSAFLVYCDEKDCGVFAMTPLYLYTGLAAPLLLAPAALEQLSGVLAVGVGDTAASWGGARVGRNKWPQSSKTLEGTAFNVLSQIGTVYALTLFGLLSVEASLVRTCLSASVCGLVEALTDQVDNLVLPLVTLLTFRVTSVMSFS